jgi:hypothetical protein
VVGAEVLLGDAVGAAVEQAATTTAVITAVSHQFLLTIKNSSCEWILFGECTPYL